MSISSTVNKSYQFLVSLTIKGGSGVLLCSFSSTTKFGIRKEYVNETRSQQTTNIDTSKVVDCNIKPNIGTSIVVDCNIKQPILCLSTWIRGGFHNTLLMKSALSGSAYIYIYPNYNTCWDWSNFYSKPNIIFELIWFPISRLLLICIKFKKKDNIKNAWVHLLETLETGKIGRRKKCYKCFNLLRISPPSASHVRAIPPWGDKTCKRKILPWTMT